MDWDELASGKGCFFDSPRPESTEHWDAVTKLNVSTLCLLRNQAYRGHCILIYDPRHVDLRLPINWLLGHQWNTQDPGLDSILSIQGSAYSDDLCLPLVGLIHEWASSMVN